MASNILSTASSAIAYGATGIRDYMTGVATLPLSFLAAEAATRVARLWDAVPMTSFENLTKTFQKETLGLKPYLTATGRTQRFFELQKHLILTNQFAPLLEEVIDRALIQNYLLGWMANAIGLNARSVPVTIARVGIASLIFGLLHMREAGLASKSGQKLPFEEIRVHQKGRGNRKISKNKAITYSRNYQVISSVALGIVYGSIYEYANQSVMASWGAHAAWNYSFDAFRFNDWK